MKYIAIVLLLQGEVKLAEIEYPDALESYAECLEYGHGMAETFMVGFWARPDIDHNNLPVVELRCKEV